VCGSRSGIRHGAEPREKKGTDKRAPTPRGTAPRLSKKNNLREYFLYFPEPCFEREKRWVRGRGERTHCNKKGRVLTDVLQEACSVSFFGLGGKERLHTRNQREKRSMIVPDYKSTTGGPSCCKRIRAARLANEFLTVGKLGL